MTQAASLIATALLVGMALATGPARADDDLPAADSAITKAAHPHHVYLVGSLRVEQAWIDPASGDGTAAAYFKVENRSDTADTLVSARLAGTAQAEITTEGGEEKGQGLVVPAHGELLLAPGRPHLVLKGVTGIAKDGPAVPGTLRFQRSGVLHLSFATDHAEAEQDDQTEPLSDDKPIDMMQ